MDAAADEELRELRARAYGPHADIEADPVALRRLQELESSRRAAVARHRALDTTSVPNRASSVGPSASPDADAPIDEVPAELRLVLPAAEASRASDDLLERLGDESLWDDATAPHPDAASGWAAHAARWRAPLWVASVVAAAALAAAITSALAWIPTLAASSEAPQVATLDLTRTGAVPPGWFGAATDVGSAEFHGLTVFESAGWMSESGDRSSENRCLSVVRTTDVPAEEESDGSSYVGGPMYGACGIGAFPATVEVPFDADTPDELVERYPSGVAMQFVLDGDRVGVFLDSGSQGDSEGD